MKIQINATDEKCRIDIEKLYGLVSVNFPGGRSAHIGQIVELILDALKLQVDWNNPIMNEVKPHLLLKKTKKQKRRMSNRKK